MINRTSIALIILLLLFGNFQIIFLQGVDADGCVVFLTEDVQLQPEKQQTAIIANVEGQQLTYISIDIQSEDKSDSVWIYPVPASPESIAFDIEDSFPEIKGTNLNKKYNNDLKDIEFGAYLLHASSMFPFGRFVLYLWDSSLASTDEEGDNTGVIVHKNIDYHGLHSELITTTESLSVFEYLSTKNLSIREGSIEQLDYYIEKEYSFILTWIVGKIDENITPCIFIQYPAVKLTFPMILTSVYGENKIPIKLIVLNHIDPIVNKEIKKDYHCTYYSYDEYHSEDENTIFHYPCNQKDGNYYYNTDKQLHYRIYDFTVIDIDSQAKNYKQDLRFEYTDTGFFDESNEAETAVFFGLIPYSIVFGFFLSMLCSFLFFYKKMKGWFYLGCCGIINPVAIWMHICIAYIVYRNKEYYDNTGKFSRGYRFLAYIVTYQLLYSIYLVIATKLILSSY